MSRLINSSLSFAEACVVVWLFVVMVLGGVADFRVVLGGAVVGIAWALFGGRP